MITSTALGESTQGYLIKTPALIYPNKIPASPFVTNATVLWGNQGNIEHFKLMPAHRLYFLRRILIDAVKVIFYLEFRAQGFFPFLDHGLELLIKPP